jgi:TolA-binding protein
MFVRAGIAIQAAVFGAVLACAPLASGQWDGTLAPAARQKLSDFESHSLKRAEDAWGKQQYRQAGVEYAAFAHEFPKSAAAPYAMFRSARCIHIQDKHAEAARAYDEVVSTYPTNLATASPAIYFKGVCETATGDPSKAHATWKELIEDPDYRQHPLAAEALQQIVDYYRGLNEPVRALIFTEKIATDYRKIHRDLSWRAVQTMVQQHVRNAPDMKKVMDLYVRCGGFDQDWRTVPADVAKDWAFWTRLAALIRENGSFPAEWVKPRRDYYSYWAGVFEPLMAEKEEFRAGVAVWYMAADMYEQAHKVAIQGARTSEKLMIAAEALIRLKRLAEALALYDEVDKGGGSDAAKAALAAAMACKDSGDSEKARARLQAFIKRYPQSPDAAKAKAELEAPVLKK